MAWVESVSASFRARHDSAHADDADRVLDTLEHTRDRLDEVFPRTVTDLTVVLHRDFKSLVMSNPLLPVTWLSTAPASRRYVAGWAGREELHVLSAEALDARASNVPGSREMLALSAAALYARRVVTENNHDLPRAFTPARLAAELRWAWLLEGAARWFSGQTEHARPAIGRRLREGGRPSFPPGCGTPHCSGARWSTCWPGRKASAPPRCSPPTCIPRALVPPSRRRSADAPSCIPRVPGVHIWPGSPRQAEPSRYRSLRTGRGRTPSRGRP